MAKNYPSLYASSSDSIALEQKMFLKLETVRGTMVLPTPTDFLLHTAGSVNYTQPFEPSPHKSGRHLNNTIEQKTSTQWSLTTFFNIDTTLGAASSAEIDPAFRLLHYSMFGYQDISAGAVYDTSTPPDITFTIMEIGDVWAKQAPGCFVDTANLTFPGDGQANAEWAGMGKTTYLVGMGKSTISNNGGNTVTVQTGEGLRFPVGSKVMLILATNAKSADTPAGSARTVTSVTGDVVTVDGAALADADGSTTPVYLVYYEPASATAIDNPQTGLVGSITIAGYGTIDNCVRSFSLNCANNHEPQDFCYGEDGLGGPLFTPGGRFTAEVSMELNLNKELVSFLNHLKNLDGDDITLILGNASGRHLQIEVPRAIFPIPEVSVPETGTIPVTFTGNAYQTALDAADEVTLSYI
jgi:hypothetical protein